MGQLKQWFDAFLGIDEIDDENYEIPAELPEATKPSVFPHEKENRPDPPRATTPPPSFPISIFEPVKFTDCKTIADKFKANSAVIVNYSMITQTEAQKIFYFMKGCVYALDGYCEKISENIYLYTPKSIAIQKPTPKSFEDTLRVKWKR